MHGRKPLKVSLSLQILILVPKRKCCYRQQSKSSLHSGFVDLDPGFEMGAELSPPLANENEEEGDI